MYKNSLYYTDAHMGWQQRVKREIKGQEFYVQKGYANYQDAQTLDLTNSNKRSSYRTSDRHRTPKAMRLKTKSNFRHGRDSQPATLASTFNRSNTKSLL
jgi:hypothetical protein